MGQHTRLELDSNILDSRNRSANDNGGSGGELVESRVQSVVEDRAGDLQLRRRQKCRYTK